MPTSWPYTILGMAALATKPGQQFSSGSSSNIQPSTREKPSPLTETQTQQYPPVGDTPKELTVLLALGKPRLLFSQRQALTDKTYRMHQSPEDAQKRPLTCCGAGAQPSSPLHRFSLGKLRQH